MARSGLRSATMAFMSRNSVSSSRLQCCLGCLDMQVNFHDLKIRTFAQAHTPFTSGWGGSYGVSVPTEIPKNTHSLQVVTPSRRGQDPYGLGTQQGQTCAFPGIRMWRRHRRTERASRGWSADLSGRHTLKSNAASSAETWAAKMDETMEKEFLATEVNGQQLRDFEVGPRVRAQEIVAQIYHFDAA